MGSKNTKGSNELFTCHGSNLMKSQNPTAHAVQDNYLNDEMQEDVVDACFSSMAMQQAMERYNCLLGRLELEPEAMSGGTLRGTVSNAHQNRHNFLCPSGAQLRS